MPAYNIAASQGKLPPKPQPLKASRLLHLLYSDPSVDLDLDLLEQPGRAREVSWNKCGLGYPQQVTCARFSLCTRPPRADDKVLAVFVFYEVADRHAVVSNEL